MQLTPTEALAASIVFIVSGLIVLGVLFWYNLGLGILLLGIYLLMWSFAFIVAYAVASPPPEPKQLEPINDDLQSALDAQLVAAASPVAPSP